MATTKKAAALKSSGLARSQSSMVARKHRRPFGRKGGEPKIAAPTRARNQNAKGRDDRSFLAMYFREMSALDVLKPEEEVACARRIEEFEVAFWEAALSHAPMVDYALKYIEKNLESEHRDFRQVRRTATILCKTPTEENRLSFERTVRKCCERLQREDRDRTTLEALITHLRQLAAGQRIKPAPKIKFDMTTPEFSEYLKRVSAVELAASRSRNDFVRANLRLVVSIARRFNHGRMALADLIQEGNIGLMKAVERYDYRRGFRFSTYASWWIRHAISRALADKGREVRLPVHMIDAYHRLSKAKRELTLQHGRQPTVEELAGATDISAPKIEKMRTFLVEQSFSLDRPVNDDDGRHFVEFLEDPKTRDTSPADDLAQAAVTKEVRALLHELKPIEADILTRRFGLTDDKEQTLKQIGEAYNLSRERIRQLQEQALGKVRRALARKDLM